MLQLSLKRTYHKTLKHCYNKIFPDLLLNTTLKCMSLPSTNKRVSYDETKT